MWRWLKTILGDEQRLALRFWFIEFTTPISMFFQNYFLNPLGISKLWRTLRERRSAREAVRTVQQLGGSAELARVNEVVGFNVLQRALRSASVGGKVVIASMTAGDMRHVIVALRPPELEVGRIQKDESGGLSGNVKFAVCDGLVTIEFNTFTSLVKGYAPAPLVCPSGPSIFGDLGYELSNEPHSDEFMRFLQERGQVQFWRRSSL